MTENIINLQWAQWEEWFQKYHEFRNLYLDYSGDVLFNDVKSISMTMKYFYKYVNAVRVQTAIFEKKIDFDTKMQKIISLYTKKQYSDAIEQANKLYLEIEQKLMELKITPKPEQELTQDPLDGIDTKTKHALKAYEIMYG